MIGIMITKEELQEIGLRLFKIGWQTRFAEHLGITPQHFRRYLSGRTVMPKSRENQIRLMVFLKKKGLWEDYVSETIYNTVREFR